MLIRDLSPYDRKRIVGKLGKKTDNNWEMFASILYPKNNHWEDLIKDETQFMDHWMRDDMGIVDVLVTICTQLDRADIIDVVQAPK